VAAAKFNFLIEQGATFKKTLTFKDSGGALQDLTGLTFRGKVSAEAGGAILATFVCTVLNQITNTGEMTIELSASDTAAIPTPDQEEGELVYAQYLYDIERINLDLTVDRVLQGLARVAPEVTT
jgi:hypothetical protein